MPQSHAALLVLVYILKSFKECTVIIEGRFLATHFHIFLLCYYEEYDIMSEGLYLLAEAVTCFNFTCFYYYSYYY